MKTYDQIVVGTGGATKLILPVADLGKKVAVIEKGPLGGTCLNRGCIPSKMLIYPAYVRSLLNELDSFHISLPKEPQTDFKALVRSVSNKIDSDSQSIEPYYTKHPNIDLYRQDCSFIDNYTLRAGNEILHSKRIILGIGARPKVPNIPGLEGTPYMTSKDALRSQTLPKKLLVIGGGYIAAELGYFFSAFGSETHFIVRSSVLREEDEEIQHAIEDSFQNRFHIHLNTSTKSVSYDGNHFTVAIEDPSGKSSQLTGDALLVATGIQPWTDQIGIDRTEIKLRDGGYIDVDSYLQTSVPGVYALGDCVGNYVFRHSANFEGEYLFHNLYETDSPAPIEYPPMPHAVFTRPQIAGVGKTEQELRKEKTPYYKTKHFFKDVAMGSAMRTDEGFCKLLFHQSDQRLLGAHIIGHEASDLIHTLIAVMTMKGTQEDLRRMIYIHPALPEVIRGAAKQQMKIE